MINQKNMNILTYHKHKGGIALVSAGRRSTLDLPLLLFKTSNIYVFVDVLIILEVKMNLIAWKDIRNRGS